MKYLLLLFLFLSFSIAPFAQPDEIKRIMARQKSGEDLSEQEEATFEKWIDEIATNPASVASKSGGKKSDCPILNTTNLKFIELPRDSYVALAKELLAAYGPRSDDVIQHKESKVVTNLNGEKSIVTIMFTLTRK